ncbi:futalosine hydrolase [Evansella tamaricis]|uniref:Futalosine hydrolase n=1 Tax=Evansella tamaricis TaxID=2069301 RepID=A0ABS6JIX9_9BACI|nr:futalosine hydrolase [Evansella tamaricis]MBU9713620.1 futalosine hydrolase [Evansella tamaricis]
MADKQILSSVSYKNNEKQILIVTAVEAEKNAIERGLGSDTIYDISSVGVGPVESAINTVKILMKKKYSLVICAGIGGGFPERAEIGSIVLASKIIAADLGAESPEGFIPVEELGFGKSVLTPDLSLIPSFADCFEKAGINVATAPILTLATVTGTLEKAEELSNRIQGAGAEAMEGFGVASASNSFDIPFMEFRAISNPVGPRDRHSWKIKEAMQTLEKAGTALKEVFKQ